MIKANYDKVQENIVNACKEVGRNHKEVTLIAVSKTKPLPMLEEAYAAGARDFGENKVQELQEKIPNMPADIRWHMIGHLQRNKVKYIIGKVYMIHSVDSLRLAEEISKESIKADVTTKILIEINVAGEDSKFGTSDMNANLELLDGISKLPNLCICGLMTIAPYTEDAESNRGYFKTLKTFAVNEAAKYLPENPVLSMGMTGDYMIACQEGSTYVRVGTGIFGERDYSIAK